jgi:hypothetical protein
MTARAAPPGVAANACLAFVTVMSIPVDAASASAVEPWMKVRRNMVPSYWFASAQLPARLRCPGRAERWLPGVGRIADVLDGRWCRQAYNQFRRTEFGEVLEPVWSQAALHRPAEFNKSHVPAFLAEEEARPYICVYPFVRSYEWYLLPDAERRALLAEHGKMAREYPDVRANTVSSFALGDYEWILAFEADELYRIVDLMRHLRGSETRRHVREEVPFFTGRRRQIADIVGMLP